MIFRQLFDYQSSTFTYLLAERSGGEVLFIDPVLENTEQYDSLFGKLLKLPDETLVYPAHDYNSMTVSSIGEEKRHNPRLQVADKQAYIELMNGLVLEEQQLMDVAVPSNRQCGLKAVA